jgi:hypothetical protein
MINVKNILDESDLLMFLIALVTLSFKNCRPVPASFTVQVCGMHSHCAKGKYESKLEEHSVLCKPVVTSLLHKTLHGEIFGLQN